MLVISPLATLIVKHGIIHAGVVAATSMIRAHQGMTAQVISAASSATSVLETILRLGS